jgi:hypothetical protein
MHGCAWKSNPNIMGDESIDLALLISGIITIAFLQVLGMACMYANCTLRSHSHDPGRDIPSPLIGTAQRSRRMRSPSTSLFTQPKASTTWIAA